MNKKYKKIIIKTFIFILFCFQKINIQALELTNDFTLDNDITDGIHIPSGANVTLDLNGYKVTGSITTTNPSTSNTATIVNEGTLIITDTSDEKTGHVEGGYDKTYAILNRNGKLTINEGKFSIVTSAYTCGGTNKAGCYTYNGPSLISNGWYDGTENTEETYSELIINGGTFIGGINNIKNDEYGKLTINNGNFISLKYTDVLSTNSPILAGENVLTGGKAFKLINGTFDSDIAVQMLGANQERTFEITGGTFDEDPSTGSRIEVSNGKYDNNIYTTFIVENIKLQKLDTSNLNIQDLTIKNVETTNSNSLSSMAFRVRGNALIQNVTTGKKLSINGLGTDNKITINNLTGGELTISGDIEINNSELSTIKFGADSSVISAGSFTNVTSDWLAISRSTTNASIYGGNYNKITNSANSTGRSATNGSSIIINEAPGGNVASIKSLYASGLGNITINNASITEQIETSYQSTINIKDGTYTSALNVYDVEKNDEIIPGGTIEVTGGKFSNSLAEVNNGYVKEGFTKYIFDDDNYIVDEIIELPASFDKILKVGDTYNYNLSTNDYYTVSIDGTSVELNNNSVLAKTPGKTIITITSKEYKDNPNVNQINFIVYDVQKEVENEIEENQQIIYTEINKIINNIINENNVTNISEETKQKLKTAIENGQTIETIILTNELSSLNDETLNQIEKQLKSIIGDIHFEKILDINLIIKAGETEIGTITKLSNQIEIALELPNEAIVVPENTTRNYFVVRMHNNEAELLESELIDNKLVFETDSFSIYAYGYIDNKTLSNETNIDEKQDNTIETKENQTKENNLGTKTNPFTGDRVIIFVVLIILTIGAFALTFIKNQKK